MAEAVAVRRELPKAQKRKGGVRRVKFLLAALVIVGAIGYLGVTNFQNTAKYAMTLDEMLTRKEEIVGQEIRVYAKVVNGTIEREFKTSTLKFVAFDDKVPSLQVPIVYRGTVPDTFKDDAEVVLEGKYSPNEGNGVFEARTLLAKCPSKYEPE